MLKPNLFKRMSQVFFNTFFFIDIFTQLGIEIQTEDLPHHDNRTSMKRPKKNTNPRPIKKGKKTDNN